MGAQPEYLPDILEIFQKVCSPERIRDFLILNEVMQSRNGNNKEPRIYLAGNFTESEEELEKKLKKLFGKKRKIEAGPRGGERMRKMFNEFLNFIEPLYNRKNLYTSLIRNYPDEKITDKSFGVFFSYFLETFYNPLKDGLIDYMHDNYSNTILSTKPSFRWQASPDNGVPEDRKIINGYLCTWSDSNNLFGDSVIEWTQSQRKQSLKIFLECIENYINKPPLNGLWYNKFAPLYFKIKGKPIKNFYNNSKKIKHKSFTDFEHELLEMNGKLKSILKRPDKDIKELFRLAAIS
jgi:hypothetical protein